MLQQKYPIGFHRSDNGSEEKRLLIVILHGWTGSPDQMRDIRDAVCEAYLNESLCLGIDFYIPHLPYSKFFCFTPSIEIINNLLKAMDAICKEPERYSCIVLIGFSLGAVFARRLFLEATKISIPIPNADTVQTIPAIVPCRWVNKVKRIINIGGLNRGWLSSGRLNWIESFITNLIGLFGHIWSGANKPTIYEARRGAPFIVQTRLLWLALRRSTDENKPEPLVIQLLGTQDNIVSPDDAIDFAVDRSLESPYFYVELPNTQHRNATDFRDKRFGTERKKRFIEVLKSSKEQLERIAIRSDYLADTLPAKPDESVNHVVFVIHGIRDDGYWTRKIAQKIHECAAAHNDIKPLRCITSSYGYFPMLPFFLPWIRRQKVEWLMDEYVGACARFPKALFSYVGHSNGTYLVARALQDYPAARFHNVLFAGSVVQRDYDWATLFRTKRVSKVVNMVATHDWVVALFPQGLEPLRRFFDLGGAGFGGFNQCTTETNNPNTNNLREVRYVIGSHSAGLVERQWPRIADFIVKDKVPPKEDQDYAPKQSFFWKIISKLSTILLGFMLVIIIAILACIIYPVFIPETMAIKASVHTLLAILYLIGLRFVIMRV